MLRRKFVSLLMAATGTLTALAGVWPGVAVAQGVPAVAAPANVPSYVDNRGDAVSLLISYFNAIDRKEYARAYGYWETGSQVGGFAQFEAGFATTQSVIVTTGQVGGSAGAGQRYFVVPVTLQSTTSSGPLTYVGCYVLHLALPELQAAPPFHPLGIASATIVQVTNGANPDSLRAQACTTAGLNGTSAVTIAQTPGAPESGAQFYVDNRSGALETLQSLFNAINRKEFARAYAYWETSTSLPSFNSFQQGYANTQSVQWSFGAVSSDAGAGQFYYSVPVTLRAQTTGGLQTFVGCYVLHLSNPGIQSAPPYQPLGIHSASVTQVGNNADTNTLMAQACQNPAPQPPPNNAPIHVSFAPGSTSATLGGSVPAGGTQEYRLWAGARQLMLLDFEAAQPNAYLQILAGSSGQVIGQTAPGVTHWQGTLPSTRQYWIRVISTGSATSYSLGITIPRRINFARGAISAAVFGNVAAGGINSYLLRALGGQTMTAALNVPTAGVWLEIYGLTDGQPLLRASSNATHWTGVLPANQDYIVKVISLGPHATYYLSVTIH
jgi:hypothetical protein